MGVARNRPPSMWVGAQMRKSVRLAGGCCTSFCVAQASALHHRQVRTALGHAAQYLATVQLRCL